VVGPRAACQRRLYIDVVGVGRRHLDQGVILVARQLVLFESPYRGSRQRVVVSNFATGRSLRPALLAARNILADALSGPRAGMVALSLGLGQ
jgi:hypothetical protein